MTLVTSNHKYDILSFRELTEKQQEKARKDLAWLDDIESSFGFFEYKREMYHLGYFVRHNEFLTDEKTGKKFYAHGIYKMSDFTGFAVKFNSSIEMQIAYYY